MGYLAIPARAVPLTLVLAFALGLALAAKAGLLGLPLALLLTSWTFKYAFVAFDAVSRGFDEPPVLSIEMVNPANEQRPLGMLLIVGVLYGATAALAPIVGEIAISILRVAALALLPASLLALGVTGRIIDAVNPRLLVDLVRRLGIDYPILLGAIAALTALLGAVSSSTLWLAGQLAVLLFGILALFCLMGGIVYQRRDTLGIDAWRSPERAAAREQAIDTRALDRDMDEIYGHWRGGAFLEAWQALQTKLQARNHDFAAYADFHGRLARWPDPRMANRLAREFITRLLAARQGSEALRIARQRIHADASFRPASGAELVHLVHLARAGGDRATAGALLADFDRHFPNDPARAVVQQLQSEGR